MGLFNIFSKKEEIVLKDFSELVVDMHSHLIPGIDDGSKTIESSIELIKNLNDLGYKKLITTPHIMSDYFRNTPDIIHNGLTKLKLELENSGIDIEIEAAAEYYVDFEFQKKLRTEKLLTFGGNYVLFELSYYNSPQNLEEVIFELQTNGYKPILAHPERYSYWHNNFEIYSNLKDKGVFFQLNLNSLTGEYSPLSKKIAEKLIDSEYVEFLGTDTHNLRHIELLKNLFPNKHLNKLVSSGKLLNNTL
jgi:tyrosine-protein phosphatase YwqE